MTSPAMTKTPQMPYSSFASRKRSSPTVKPLPASAAWLKDLTLEMTASTGRRGVQYELRVFCQPKGGEATSWGVRHSFDQYKSLQKRLLRQLLPAHSCQAECRWLRSIIKKHFPRQTLFGARCPTVVEQRRKALLQLLTTVQAAIVNYGNRSCNVLMQDVSREFAAFLLDDSVKSDGAASLPVTPSTSSELELDTPHSLASVTSDDSDDDVVALDYDEWNAWELPVEHFSLERTNSSPV